MNKRPPNYESSQYAKLPLLVPSVFVTLFSGPPCSQWVVCSVVNVTEQRHFLYDATPQYFTYLIIISLSEHGYLACVIYVVAFMWYWNRRYAMFTHTEHSIKMYALQQGWTNIKLRDACIRLSKIRIRLTDREGCSDGLRTLRPLPYLSRDVTIKHCCRETSRVRLKLRGILQETEDKTSR